MFYVLYNLAYSTRTYSKSVKMSLSCAFIKLRMTHAYKMSAHTIYSSSITAYQLQEDFVNSFGFVENPDYDVICK